MQALSLQPTRQAEVARGWQYLRAAQGAGGGWAGAAGVNSNSTGLATQAVLALLDKGGYVTTAATPTGTGSTPAGSVIGAQAAFGFLEGLQRADGGFDVSATEAGDESTRTRATTQAVPALAGAVLTTLLDPITPVDPPAPPTSTTTSTSATLDVRPDLVDHDLGTSTSTTSPSTTTTPLRPARPRRRRPRPPRGGSTPGRERQPRAGPGQHRLADRPASSPWRVLLLLAGLALLSAGG